MASILCLVLMVLAMLFSRTSCLPAKTPTFPPNSALPAVLSGDQSLPVSMTLPADAMPMDLMVGMNQPGAQAVPAVINRVKSAGGQYPPQPGMTQTGQTSGQGQYPVALNSLNYMAAPGMTNIVQMPAQASSGQGFRNTISTGQVRHPTGMSPSAMTPPMNMYTGQMMPSVQPNVVLMNMQMACHSLQSFVHGSPMSKEIMTSVANMNNFRTNTQCGLPALSASLRMFLKTCNMFTSCPSQAYAPFPTFFQPVSPAVPYMTHPPKPKPKGSPVIPKGQKALKNTPVSKILPQYQPQVQPMMRMFQSLMYGVRPNQINNRAGQKAPANTNQEPSGASDD